MTDDVIKSQSPLFQIDKVKTAMLISYGGDESFEFKRQSEEYFNTLVSNGCKAELVEQKGKNHFMTFHDLNDPESTFCKLIVDFIKRNNKS